MPISQLYPPGQLVNYIDNGDSDLLAAAIAETLVAFANSDGGTIILGVDPQGHPTTPIYTDELEGLLLAAERACRPLIHTGWEQFELADGTAYAITVPRSLELHSLEDGRVLIRAGKENRPLGGAQIRQLAATKATADFETEEVPGASWDDLSAETIATYIEKRAARQRKPLQGTPQDILTEIGALSPQGNPTIFGMLLFGTAPQHFLPQSGLVFVKFIGTEPRGEQGLPGYGRREEIQGSLSRVIEQAWQTINEEMVVGAVVTGLERREISEYPPFAVREALVNAVAHRDYRIRGRRIEVRMFTDRLEVISPGGLPGFITVDNIVEEHYSRNPSLVSGLFQWGYIEELGLGIDRMIEDMVAEGHSPPEFKAQPHMFTVVLHNNRKRRPVAASSRRTPMNERQARALSYIREHGSITNREYRRLCPDVSPESLRLDLVDLVNRGVLLKIGAKKGTYYILK